MMKTMLGCHAPVKLGSPDRANGSHVPEQEFTEDAILDGRIRVRQPARGYRVNVDTILLAAAVEVKSGMRLMEAGCGVGAAVLAVAQRAQGASFLGIEREANIAALARENVAMNEMSACVEILTGDVLERSANVGVFDGVFLNPPFDQAGDGHAPAEARWAAQITDAPIDAWISALADRLSGNAALTMIHRASKLAEILAAIDGRLGGVEIVPIHPSESTPAKRVLVRARKGSRAPLRLLRGIALRDVSGAKHTPQVEAILRGEAQIAWV
jgi:tRNA1(Val) A37 N6-methylase TrmN6